ncbi:hypothetical protein AB8O64_10925 [Streptomyces sp. QH1-20]|uniref:hypothetical protein n=1 Tax=Streptomyces sp. QH1-20 TaxID=3240934 RepID=UPI003517AB8B
MWKDLRPTVAVMALAGLTCGAVIGYLLGLATALAISASLCCGAAAGLGAFLRLRRVQQQTEAMRTGFRAGLAQGVLVAVACYHRAAFPRTGQGAVTTDEVTELRWVAYQQAATERLATPVREAAARALKAVDRREATAAHSLLMELMYIVHEQHYPGPAGRPVRR